MRSRETLHTAGIKHWNNITKSSHFPQECRSKSQHEVKSDCSNLDELPTLYFELDGAEATCALLPLLLRAADDSCFHWSR